MTVRTLIRAALILAFAVSMIGCQGKPKDKPPIHVNPNMDTQPKFLPQSESDFFADGKADRAPVEGTIARGDLRLPEDDPYFRGMKPGTDEPIDYIPVSISATSLARGKERFEIYCAVCHASDGSGRSIMVEKQYQLPPSYHEEPLLSRPDGHYYDVISNGIRNMPGYANQIPVDDRWKIVQYVRALQRSQAGSVSDVPEEQRDRFE
ncbi:cytochrome c [bacterium]|nr:cytochrome c [bacterium]